MDSLVRNIVRNYVLHIVVIKYLLTSLGRSLPRHQVLQFTSQNVEARQLRHVGVLTLCTLSCCKINTCSCAIVITL